MLKLQSQMKNNWAGEANSLPCELKRMFEKSNSFLVRFSHPLISSSHSRKFGSRPSPAAPSDNGQSDKIYLTIPENKTESDDSENEAVRRPADDHPWRRGLWPTKESWRWNWLHQQIWRAPMANVLIDMSHFLCYPDIVDTGLVTAFLLVISLSNQVP